MANSYVVVLFFVLIKKAIPKINFLVDDPNYFMSSSSQYYECQNCSKSYNSIGNLRRHQKYECGVKPKFTCIHCNAKYKYQYRLREHMERKCNAQIMSYDEIPDDNYV